MMVVMTTANQFVAVLAAHQQLVAEPDRAALRRAQAHSSGQHTLSHTGRDRAGTAGGRALPERKPDLLHLDETIAILT